jgi:predicted nucleotidyltransferase
MVLTFEQQKALAQIGRAHRLKFIILHGSYAKGIARREGSDLDIAILGKQKIPFAEVLEIHGQLASIFGDNPERELDLTTLHGVDPLFRHQVTKGGLLLYGDRSEYQEFKAFAYRDFMDSYDLRKLEETLTKRSIVSLLQRYAG